MESLADFLGVEHLPRDPAVPAKTPLVDDTTTIQEFAKRVLASREYRQSVVDRIVTHSLPAQIEAMLYHYAEGKPTERVEHTGKDGSPIVTEIRRVIVRAPSFDEDDVPVTVTH